MKSRQYEGEKNRTPEKGRLKDLNKKKNEKIELIIGKDVSFVNFKEIKNGST